MGDAPTPFHLQGERANGSRLKIVIEYSSRTYHSAQFAVTITKGKQEYMPDPTSSAFDHSSMILPTNAAQKTRVATKRALLPNKILTIIWRILIIVASLTGILINSKSIGDFINKLLYFTIQSNIMLAVCMGYALWATLRNTSQPTPLIKGAVTVYISITGLVYNLILAKTAGPPAAGSIVVPLIGGTLNNDLLHIFAPIMAVLDWLLFDVRGNLSWRYPLQWLTYPLIYLVFVLIRGPLVHGPFIYPYLQYPYLFLNVATIGYSGVALNTVIYGIAFWLIGLIFIVVDRAIARFQRQNNH